MSDPTRVPTTNAGHGPGGRGKGGRSQRSGPPKPTFRAPTAGHESIYFDPTTGAARFNENNERLASHVAVKIKGGGIVAKAVLSFTPPAFEEPEEPDPDDRRFKILLHKWEQAYSETKKAIASYREAAESAYHLYLQHCTPAMKTKLSSMADWEAVKESQDVVALAKMLRLICHRKGDGQKRGMLELVQAVRAVHLLTMREENRLDEYQGFSQANIEVCEALGVKIGRYEAAADIVLEEQGSSVEKVKAEAAEAQKLMLELMSSIGLKMAEAGIAAQLKTERGQEAEAAAAHLKRTAELAELKYQGGLAADAKAEAEERLEAALKEGATRFKAALLFSGLNNKPYGELKRRVNNDFLAGIDTVPKTEDAVIRRALGFQGTPAYRQPASTAQKADEAGVAFGQVGKEEKRAGAARDGKEKGRPAGEAGGAGNTAGTAASAEDGTKANAAGRKDCFHCGKTDHWSRECPDLTPALRQELSDLGAGGWAELCRQGKVGQQPGQSHINVAGDADEASETPVDREEAGFGFLQNSERAESDYLDEDKAYLDTTSSFHQARTTKHLSGVQKVSNILRGSCNAGTTFSDEKGWCKGRFHMWLVRQGIANLLSLPQLEADGFRATYDTDTGWKLYCPDGPEGTHVGGTELILKRDAGVCRGFPYLDLAELEAKASPNVAMVQTVRNNMEGFTEREVKRATLAGRAQQMIGCPTDEEFMSNVSTGSLKGPCPISPVDVANKRVIFGPDLPNIQGKTVRTKPDRVDTDNDITIHSDYHRFVAVTLTADIMFVNGLPFLTTLSQRIRLCTSEHLPTRTAPQLGSSLMKIVRLYARGGFVVKVIL